MAADFCNICGEGAEGGPLLKCCEQTCTMTAHFNCLPKGARAGLKVSLLEWRCAGCWMRLETQQKKGQENLVGVKKGSEKAKSVQKGIGKKGGSAKSVKVNSVQGGPEKEGGSKEAQNAQKTLGGVGKKASEKKQVSERQRGSKRKGPELGCPDRSKKLKGVADLYPPISPDTVCGVCRKPEPDDCMLLCETVECNETSHTFCCKPPLRGVPKGAWYCQKCAHERETEKGTRGGNGVARSRLQKRKGFHGARVFEEEKEHIMGLDDEDSDSGSSVHPDIECDICGSPESGDVMLLCSSKKCEARQHTFCCTPPLRKVPSGDWFCPQCTAAQQEGSLLLDGTRCLFQDGGKKQRQCANPRARAGKYCWEHTEFQETPPKKNAESETPESQNAEPAEADYDSSVDPEMECDICGSPDNSDVMLLCSGDKCKRGQHTFCCSPELAKVPSGDWFCPDCCGNEGTAKFEAVSKLLDDGVRCTMQWRSANGLRQCIAERQAGYKRCKYHRGQMVQQTKRFKKRKLDKQTGEDLPKQQVGQWSEGLVDDGVRCKHYSRRDGAWVYQCTRKRAPGVKCCQHHRAKSVKHNEKVREQLSLVGSGAKFVIKRQPLRKSPRALLAEKKDPMQAEQIQEEARGALEVPLRGSASVGKRQEKASKPAAPGTKKTTTKAPVTGIATGKAHKGRTAKRTPAEADAPASPSPNNEGTPPSGDVDNTRPTAGSPLNEGSPFDPVSLFLRDEPVTPPQDRLPPSEFPGGRNAVKNTPPEGARQERLNPQEESPLNGTKEGAEEKARAEESFLAKTAEMLRKMVAEEVRKAMEKGTLAPSPHANLAADEGGQNTNGTEPPEKEGRAASPTASLQQGGSKDSGRPDQAQREEEKTAQAPECSQAPPEGGAKSGSEQRSGTCAEATAPAKLEFAQARFKTALPQAADTSSRPVQERAPSPAALSVQGASASVEQTERKEKGGAQLDSESRKDIVPERADRVDQTAGKEKHGAESEPEPQSDVALKGTRSGEAVEKAGKRDWGAQVKTEPQTESVPEHAESDRDFAAEQPFERSASAEDGQAGGQTATAGDRVDGAERREERTPSEAAELLDSTQVQQRKVCGATPSAAIRRRSFDEACRALARTASESPPSKTPNPELDLNRPAKPDGGEPRDLSPNGSFQSQTSAVTDSQKRQPKVEEDAAKSSAPMKPVSIMFEPELLVPKEEPKETRQPLRMVTPQAGSPAASASVSDPASKDACPKSLEAAARLSQSWKKPRLNLH